MKTFLRDDRGNTIVMVALSLPLLFAAAGAALDYTDLSRKKTELQSLSDTAALAATKALASSASFTPTQKEQDARAVADRFLSDKAPEAQRTITPSAATNSVKVELAYEQSLRFAGFIGSRSVSVATQSEATYSDPPGNCIIALGQGTDPGLEMVGAAKITAPRCGVWSDSPAANSITLQGAPRMAVRSVCAVGGISGGKSLPSSKSGCSVASDPYQTRAVKCGKNQDKTCAVYAPAPGSTGGGGGGGGGGDGSLVVNSYTGACDFTNVELTASSKGIAVLSPGVYCGGLSVQSTDVVLLPGFYQIQDGPLSLQGNATLKGTEVSILLSGVNAVLDFQGNPQVRLSAMLTGPLAGIAISSNTPSSPLLSSTLQGSPDVSLTGSIRLPNQILKMQGSPTLTLDGASDKAIAYEFSMTGSPDLIVKADDSKDLQGGFAELRLVR
jgi:Flp pilus assembly protein TadG